MRTESTALRYEGMKKIRGKYINRSFTKKVLWSIFRLVFLAGVSFIILYPFIVKLSSALMSQEDLLDKTVRFIPRYPTLENVKFVIEYTKYFTALTNTVVLSVVSAALQMAICTVIGYGLAKFPFKGREIVFGLVVFTILIPPQTILIPMFMKFRFFDIFGILSLTGGQAINLLDSLWPMLVLSLTGFGFKNGLYIFIMRQFFKGVPDELEEAAYVDGATSFRTFMQIIIPLSIPMMVTIFLFAFSWQWTDTFYSSLFFSNFKVLSNIVFTVSQVNTKNIFAGTLISSTMINTAALLVVLPLVVFYLFAQRSLIQGIERSGIVG